jgi:hypothetical protein
MALNQIQVGYAEPLETLMHAEGYAFRAEVEVVVAIPPGFGGKHVLVAVDASQRLAQHSLGGGEAVVRGDVEEGDAQGQRGAHRLDAVLFGARAVDTAQRRGAESKL